MMNPDGIAPLLRHLRRQSGRRLEDIAAAISDVMGEECQVQNPKRWENGTRMPNPRYRDAIAEVYGIPRREVDKAVDSTKRAERLNKIELEGTESDEVDRRTFLGAAAIAAGAAAEPWGRLAAVLGGGPVDSATVEALQETTAGMFESEEHVPARLMIARLTSHLDTLTALLPNAGRYQAALAIAAGETAALAGWMSFDLGDMEKSRRYYGVALQAGRFAGHGAVSALTLGYGSYSTSAVRARDMLTEAQRDVRGPGYATAQAWLSAREAEEAAKLGDHEGAVRALERARTAFDYADPVAEQAWVAFFRRARLGSMAISTYATLGHPELGSAIAEALADLGQDDAKIRCSVLGDAALGCAAAGDVDQAVAIGARALDATVQDDTTMGRTRLAALAKQLPDAAEAIELRERIRAIVPD